MDVLLLLLLLTTLAHGQCTVDKDIHITFTSVQDIFYQDLLLLLLLTTLAHGHCTVDKDIHSHSGQRYSLILHSFWSIEAETFTQRNVHTNAATNTSRKAFISANT